MKIYQDLGMRPTVFLRREPGRRVHVDRAGNKHPSCFRQHKTQDVPWVRDKEAWQQHLDVLKDRLYQAVKVPEAAITTEFLFYDGFQ